MASLVKWLFGSGAHGVDGLPVATGTAYFYTPGSTSEQITVYADPTELEILTQPVTLDAAGRAEVYAKVPFEIKVLDALGAQVLLSERAESVAAAQVDCSWGSASKALSTVLTELETSLGASGAYVESGSAGVVARTYHDALHSAITPQDFNATGNGIADDTTPLQRAIDRAIATQLPLNLGYHTYKVTSGLTVNGNLSMFSPSTEACLIFGATSFDLLTIDSGADYAGVNLSDFSVLCPDGAGVAIKLTRCANAKFDGLNATARYGFLFASGCSALLTRSTVYVGAAGTAFSLTDGVDCVGCEANMTVGGAAVGFDAYGGSTLIGCKTTGGATGYKVSGASTTPTTFLRCSGSASAPTIGGGGGIVSLGCSWNPVPGIVAGTPVTADFGTITRTMVEEPLYSGGVKTVTFMINVPVAKYGGVVLTLAGVAAMATGIKSVQATINAIIDTAAAQIRHTSDANQFTLKIVGTSDVGGVDVFVTVKGY